MVISEGDPEKFKQFSRIDIYQFNFRILALKKAQKQQRTDDDPDTFGIGRKGTTDW